MSTINLKNLSYKTKKIQETALDNEKDNYKELNAIVDDIVEELVNKNAKLITDVEKGIIPGTVLEQQVINYIDVNKIMLTTEKSRQELINKVRDYLFGYGPIQDLINDLDVSDIKLIDENNVRKKVKGRRMDSGIRFPSKKSYKTFCSYVCIKNGGSISQQNAVQKLSDYKSSKDFNLRLDICFSPVNYISPSIAIRKIPKDKPTLDKLYEDGMFNREIQEYLIMAIEAGLKIIWCGKGASGKTTLMNACIEYIPHENSALVLQETVELHSKHPDMIFQLVQYKKGESEIEYTFHGLTTNGLLMDLDYIILSEIKEEAFSLFNAGYTGHKIWTGVHSNDSASAPNKIVHYMKEGGTDYTRAELLEMISSMDLIIYMEDYKCAELTEIGGFDYETNRIIFNNVFKFNSIKRNGRIVKGTFERTNKSCERIQDKFNRTEFVHVREYDDKCLK